MTIRIALVLSGGIGLGVYHGGVYSALHANNTHAIDWIAGSSVGAVTGAVIAGTAPAERVGRVRELWLGGDEAAESTAARTGPWRHARNWASVLQGRLAGVPGHFHPRFISAPFERFSSFYDLSPLRARLSKLVDFDRLNGGEVRFCAAATDVKTGELVLFDTGCGERITLDHLMASCGYLPEFAPVDIDGRLLADGGLSANAPLEAVFLRDDASADERICVVVDLFPRDGGLPTGVQTALARKNDLMFANQTFMRLEGFQRESVLRDELAAASGTEAGRIRNVYYLSYRAPPEEAGPERTFDLSPASARDRWQAGALDMQAALAQLVTPAPQGRGWRLHVIRR